MGKDYGRWKKNKAREVESIAVALIASGVKIFRYTVKTLMHQEIFLCHWKMY